MNFAYYLILIIPAIYLILAIAMYIRNEFRTPQKSAFDRAIEPERRNNGDTDSKSVD